MEQGEAVAVAIRQQLEADKRWPPPDFNKTMTQYFYTDGSTNTIGLFLSGVRTILLGGDPKYYFDFDDAFGTKALKLNVGDLTGEVDAKTQDKPPKDPKAA